MALGVDLSILNQRGTPAFFSDIFANRPAFGFAGRVFISTDTGAIYEDTGTAWTLIADAGAGTTGTLQQVTTNGNTTTQGISITAGGLSSNSITNTSLTTGSVAFVGAAGLMTQDNANFFWDDTNNRLGLGTITPTAKLDIHGSGAMALFNGTGANNGYIGFQNAGVTQWTIGNQYASGVNNFNIINNAGNSVFNITGGQQANFVYNVTIAQALTLNNVGDQLRISSGAIDGQIKTASANNLMFIGATTTGYGANIDLSTGSIALTDKVTATRFVLSGATASSGLYYDSVNNRVTVANYTAAGIVTVEVNGGGAAATFNADLSTTFAGSAILAVGGNVNSGNQLKFYRSDNAIFTSLYDGGSGATNGFILNNTNSEGFNFQNSGTSILRMTSSSLVGIGTTTPARQLEIYNANDAFMKFNGVRAGNHAFTVGNESAGFVIYDDTSAAYRLQISNSTGTTTIGGNLGIGNADSIVKLNIVGAGATSATYGIYITNSTPAQLFSVRNDGYINTGLAASSPYNYNVTFAPRTAGLDASGGIGYIVSTRESKGNIQPINNIDFINKLNPVQFNYRKKNNNNTEFIDELYDDIYFGFIADEVETINKDLVFYDNLKDGTKKLSGVEYNSMIAILTKAIQELNEKLVRNNIN